ADPALFLTRWVTHFCAPIFIFLAGVSAYLYGRRSRSVGEVSWLLLTRGLWLVLIEFTVMRFCWTFSFHIHFFVLQVIWVIGAAMIVLAGLVHLPRWVIATIGLAMIAGHNLLDHIRDEDLGSVAWLWKLLHQPGPIEIGPQITLFVLYTVVPWSGVMAAGYALGPVFGLEPRRRRSFLLTAGIAVTAAFVVLRATNLYGDPTAWSMQSSFFGTLLSFINCEKYPPSLLFLMMTLGPALILVALCERAHGALTSRITTFGRVPFFFYVVHIAFIHALAVGFAWITLGDIGWTRLVPIAKACRLWPQSPRHLRGLALRRDSTLSSLPLVCLAQARAARMVVELSLRRPAHGTVNAAADNVSAQPAASGKMQSP